MSPADDKKSARPAPAQWLGGPSPGLRPNDPWVQSTASRLSVSMKQAAADDPLSPDESEQGRHAAVRRATRIGQDDWHAWVFDFARRTRHQVSRQLPDDLYAAMFVHRPALTAAIDAYAPQLLDARSASAWRHCVV